MGTHRHETSLDTPFASQASHEPPADEDVEAGSVSQVHQTNDEESPVDETVHAGSASDDSYARLSSYQGPTRTVVGGLTTSVKVPDEESPVDETEQTGSASDAAYPRLSSYQGPTRTVVGASREPTRNSGNGRRNIGLVSEAPKKLF